MKNKIIKIINWYKKQWSDNRKIMGIIHLFLSVVIIFEIIKLFIN